ncbi:hypothetical protein L1987_60369 [Smallanthus sonchifolius]|uniref:Uncharacterized protein n=1 Tax=Smallanthus sonchifolius TaxID=185202 RepID=A0ACB9D8T4_9ASTR|nr:hypothetical protein L1987_60369 [Smallanthus sonchifolius]
MASKASLLLALSLLFTACLARQRQQQQNQCQLRNIEALEPYDIIQAEAGVTEIWDANNQLFQCAGVDFIRHRIQPGGLLLPSYVNTPILAFIERGRGVHGVILPGCPETYEYSQDQQFSGQGERRGQEFQFQDRHQKVEDLNQGDLVAIPTGAAHWVHNDGDTELVVVVFFDTQNYENQLDEYHRVQVLLSHADFVNPQAGKIANLNSFKFPILKHLQLSAERGELQRNAIQSPHWTINAHNLLYVTEGTLRVQIVDNEGNSVFDNELREGQVVVIPQNFAVIKKAKEQGARWVSFKTNDNAMIANLAGRVSAISSLPVDVVANSYQMSREDAQKLKFGQRETVLFNPGYRSQGRAST